MSVTAVAKTMSTIASEGDEHAFLWQNGKIVDLVTRPGAEYGEAVDINERTQVTRRSRR